VDNYIMAVLLLVLAGLIGLIIAWLWHRYEKENYRTADYWPKKRRKL